jgi:hypothetical protein
VEPVTNCIFCQSPTKNEPKEHIVPEGLVGDQSFEVTCGSIVTPAPRKLVLENDEVCGRCNARLGKLDSYLIIQCGFLRALWNRVGTKSGRFATAARPGMYARRTPSGPELFLNPGNRPVMMADGVRVMPASAHELAVRVERLDIQDRHARLVLRQPVRLNKRFMRAIHKIAFELLCLEKGPELVLSPEFDPLRDYILRGQGSRILIVTTSAPVGGWETPIFGLKYQPGWPGWLATVRLGMTFLIDLSPANDFIAMIDVAELNKQGMALWIDAKGGSFSTQPEGSP